MSFLEYVQKSAEHLVSWVSFSKYDLHTTIGVGMLQETRKEEKGRFGGDMILLLLQLYREWSSVLSGAQCNMWGKHKFNLHICEKNTSSRVQHTWWLVQNTAVTYSQTNCNVSYAMALLAHRLHSYYYKLILAFEIWV